MAGDGNCLFRALADQVDGSPDTHMWHRQLVCDHMARNPTEFAPFMDETCPFDRYVGNMRNPGVYGGNMELVAFARSHRVDIRVYQLGTVFVISGDARDAERHLPTVHIAYHSYEHYSSVRNRGGPHAGLPHVKESSRIVSVLDELDRTLFGERSGALQSSASRSSSASSRSLLGRYGRRLFGLFKPRS
ncbi:hypothetical protein BX070DRAFT_105270 [Coemansia spiralis]|nr:hypothetical protein BX070DRAFT_105270 [Coemansia spiralis]